MFSPHRTTNRARALVAGLVVLATAALGLVAVPMVASAAPERAQAPHVGQQFDPGLIISDSQFYKRDAMSQAEIQAFLVQMVGGCNNSNCLAIYRQTTFSRAADRTVCGAYTGAANELASMIIYKVQQACGISAKVLLVTLQKEQGLLTNSMPADSKLGRAMGYACPDSSGGACDAAFYGFYNQMYKAAWQLHRYSTPDPWGRFQPGAPILINFHPDAARCGGVGIAIRNNATAALYNYTPYVPNRAALDNLGDVGDSCSSYGNRNFWDYYFSWFGNPAAVAPVGVTVSRTTGVDRYDTSAKLSAAWGTTSAATVYIANGQNFPDALSAAPAAIMQDAPLMLVAPTFLPDPVKAELQRLHPGRIIVLGGEDSVSTDVYNQLSALTPAIERITGENRYGTSRALAERIFTAGSPLAYISTGEGFPDALSASGVAGAQNAPVILVPGSSTVLDDATKATLATLGVNHVIVTGGPTTVSTGIEDGLRAIPGMTVERITGVNRYDTASKLNRDYFSTSATVIMASGEKFPDALAGATLAGHIGAALYITPAACMYRVTAQDLIDLKTTKMTVLGGTDTLSSNVETYLNCD